MCLGTDYCVTDFWKNTKCTSMIAVGSRCYDQTYDNTQECHRGYCPIGAKSSTKYCLAGKAEGEACTNNFMCLSKACGTVGACLKGNVKDEEKCYDNEQCVSGTCSSTSSTYGCCGGCKTTPVGIVGTIVGVVIGGLCCVCIAAAIYLFFFKKNNQTIVVQPAPVPAANPGIFGLWNNSDLEIHTHAPHTHARTHRTQDNK